MSTLMESLNLLEIRSHEPKPGEEPLRCFITGSSKTYSDSNDKENISTINLNWTPLGIEMWFNDWEPHLHLYSSPSIPIPSGPHNLVINLAMGGTRGNPIPQTGAEFSEVDRLKVFGIKYKELCGFAKVWIMRPLNRASNVCQFTNLEEFVQNYNQITAQRVTKIEVKYLTAIDDF